MTTSEATSPRARALRSLIEFLPAFTVALWLLPFVISYGSFSPWQPSTIDLQVYQYTVQDLLAGQDIYLTRTPLWNLPFIYPPIAAVLMIPLAVGPYTMWQVLWTAGLIWAQNSVLKRCGIKRGWMLAVLSVALVLVVEPIRTTLGYGQINTFLMAFVLIDLLPDRPGQKRLIPRGWLIGLAAALKLTPALFLIFALAIGLRWVFVHGSLSFLTFTAIGFIVQPGPSVQFWGNLARGDTGAPASPLYVGNQAITGLVTRVARDDSTVVVLAGLALAAVVAVLAVVVAVHWWRRGEKLFAVGLIGMATCLASPLSWTHHHVWVVVLGIAVLTARRLPRWAVVVGGIWALWVALCLMLMVLPYGGGPELRYDVGQQLVANLGPFLGMILVGGLAAQLVSIPRTQPRRVGVAG